MHKIIFSGYGGQGMLLCGQLLAYAAMQEDKFVTWMPSYGPEMRGGAAYCFVIVSEKQVGSPIIVKADAVVAMNQPSFDKFEQIVAPGGYLVYHSALVTSKHSRTDINYVGIDCSKVANELNNEKVANMVALGALNGLINCVSEDAIVAALKDKFGGKKASLIDINVNAINKGKEISMN